MKDHWREYQKRWHLLEAPLRPNQEVVDEISAVVGEQRSNVLLLGVTPELVAQFPHLTAVDKSREMIAALWQSQLSTQKVCQANWLTMDDTFNQYSAVIGDCSINVLQSAAEIDVLLSIVQDRLVSNGVFACRVFERPDENITEEDLRRVVAEGTQGNFHAFKWQIAMSLAGEFGARVKAVDILARFNQLFPDRQKIAEVTGWETDVIDTIDVYEHSGLVVCFPSRREFDRHFSMHFKRYEWKSCGTYDLAERCPIVVARRL